MTNILMLGRYGAVGREAATALSLIPTRWPGHWTAWTRC